MYDAKEYPIRIQVKPSSEEFHAQIQDKQKDENAKEILVFPQNLWKWILCAQKNWKYILRCFLYSAGTYLETHYILAI